MTSLRARLLLTVSLVSITVWAIAVWVSYDKALFEADELLDGQLVQASELLRAQIQHEDGLLIKSAPYSKEHDEYDDDAIGLWNTEALNYDASLPYSQNLAFLVSDRRGIRLRSANAPNIPGTLKDGIADIKLPDGHWRILTVTHTPDLRIQTAHLRDTREKAALEVAQQVALPPLFALPLLILLVYVAVQRGLQPLNALANTVANRSVNHLDPIEQPDTPDEARPLLNSINQLLARIDIAMARERRFTADAAHELRTPIAALKIQAQVAAASHDANDRDHALAQVLQGILRAERLIEQMLRLARLDPADGLPHKTTIDLDLLLQEVFEATEGMALKSGHSLSIEPMAALPPLQGDADLLRTALINLTNNACKHTPTGCAIRLYAESHNGEIYLSVKDDGPGIDAGEINKLGFRFMRGQNASTTGSGLGLAIVQRIAELHGATLRLTNRSPHGLEATLHWEHLSS